MHEWVIVFLNFQEISSSNRKYVLALTVYHVLCQVLRMSYFMDLFSVLRESSQKTALSQCPSSVFTLTGKNCLTQVHTFLQEQPKSNHCGKNKGPLISSSSGQLKGYASMLISISESVPKQIQPMTTCKAQFLFRCSQSHVWLQFYFQGLHFWTLLLLSTPSTPLT